jgi:hypothetical protein
MLMLPIAHQSEGTWFSLLSQWLANLKGILLFFCTSGPRLRETVELANTFFRKGWCFGNLWDVFQ